jgi:hypothetical protein
VNWKLQVPFRKDLKDFRWEVITAIGRHVAKNERIKVDGLLTPSVEGAIKYQHTRFRTSTTKSPFVIINTILQLTGKDNTGLSAIFTDPVD